MILVAKDFYERTNTKQQPLMQHLSWFKARVIQVNIGLQIRCEVEED